MLTFDLQCKFTSGRGVNVSSRVFTFFEFGSVASDGLTDVHSDPGGPVPMDGGDQAAAGLVQGGETGRGQGGGSRGQGEGSG